MTKAELSDELAKATGLTKQESAGIVETVFEGITAALVKGNKVELRGFGGFKVRQHRSRTARNFIIVGSLLFLIGGAFAMLHS